MAAKQTFSKAPFLPLDQDSIANAGALEGRLRLVGAFLIELRRIRPDPNQPRKNLDTQAQIELTESIARIGILQPITVRFLPEDNFYRIITGERRFHAAKALDLPAIPCWVQSPKSEDILLHQIVENWQRRDLAPLELAQALGLLRDGNGYSQKQLAQLTGKPESEISRILAVLKTTPEVQARAREDKSGMFTRRHLTALARLPAEQQPEAARAVQDARLTAEETEHMVQKAEAKRTGAKIRGAPIGQRLRYIAGTAVVTLTFRRRNVTVEDILTALDDVRTQVTKKQP